MLLARRMFGDRSRSSGLSGTALICGCVMALCLSSSAWGQTGFSTQTGLSTTRLAIQQDNLAAPDTDSGQLSHLEGQPHLAEHLSRINQFRTLFRKDSQRPPQQKET